LKNQVVVRVRLVPGKQKTLRIPKGATIDSVLSRLGTHRDRVIVLKDGKPIPESEKIKETVTLEIIKIISGG